MKRISCQYNIDTACVEIRYDNGIMISIETVVQLSKGERSSTSLRVELDASEVDFAVLREDAVPAK